MSVAMRVGEVLLRVAITLVSACSLACLVGCGPSPAYHAHPASHPGARALPPNAVRVVPADQVKGTCHCDDDDDDDDDDAAPPRPKPVEYVKLDEWRPPPQVVELEARIPARGAAPPVAINEFPKLTLHQPIGESTFRSRRWTGAYPH
jgi:hypothetical protein